MIRASSQNYMKSVNVEIYIYLKKEKSINKKAKKVGKQGKFRNIYAKVKEKKYICKSKNMI